MSARFRAYSTLGRIRIRTRTHSGSEILLCNVETSAFLALLCSGLCLFKNHVVYVYTHK
jgi:hypothetical protein